MSTAIERLDALAGQFPMTESAGRLSFPERCAAYYLLRRGFKKSLVALTFGVSPAAMTKLANADLHGSRYVAVVHEYARLGHDEFGARYFTDEIEARLARFRMSVPTEGDLAKRRFGASPTARGAAGEYTLSIKGGPITFYVYWITAEGWAFRQDDPGGFVSRKRYVTSSVARTAALASYAALPEDILNFNPEPVL